MDMNERAHLYEHAIMRMEEVVHRSEDGLFALRVENPAELGMDPIVFADLKRSLEETNRKIKDGEIEVDSIERFSFD